MLEELQGQIERITFHNDETGFTIGRLKVKGFRELITAVGNLMAPVPGQVLHITGEWATHPHFGEQFKIVRYQTLVPATVAGIEKYLGSGLVKGIGPVMAKRIVKSFGKETLDVSKSRSSVFVRLTASARNVSLWSAKPGLTRKRSVR